MKSSRELAASELIRYATQFCEWFTESDFPRGSQRDDFNGMKRALDDLQEPAPAGERTDQAFDPRYAWSGGRG